MSIRCVLLDIEGTTTDIDFVHQVLFPYAARHLRDYVARHRQDAEVQECLTMVQNTVYEEESRAIDEDEAVAVLLAWIRQDRKHTALKALQGMIWKSGYELGEFRSHLYADVPVALEHWRNQGLRLAIYSSGSVEAQKLLFGHTVYGNMNPLFSAYFDTRMGGKKEADSYRAIARELALAPEEILFLSDVPAELNAAAEAGCRVIQLKRDERAAGSQHAAVTSFLEIDPLQPVTSAAIDAK